MQTSKLFKLCINYTHESKTLFSATTWEGGVGVFLGLFLVKKNILITDYAVWFTS